MCKRLLSSSHIFFYLFDVYRPPIMTLKIFKVYLEDLKEQNFFRIRQILYYVRKHQIDREIFHNFIYMMSHIFYKKHLF